MYSKVPQIPFEYRGVFWAAEHGIQGGPEAEKRQAYGIRGFTYISLICTLIHGIRDLGCTTVFRPDLRLKKDRLTLHYITLFSTSFTVFTRYLWNFTVSLHVHLGWMQQFDWNRARTELDLYTLDDH